MKRTWRASNCGILMVALGREMANSTMCEKPASSDYRKAANKAHFEACFCPQSRRDRLLGSPNRNTQLAALIDQVCIDAIARTGNHSLEQHIEHLIVAAEWCYLLEPLGAGQRQRPAPLRLASTWISAISIAPVRLRSDRLRAERARSPSERYRSSSGRENHSDDTLPTRSPRVTSTS